MASKAIYTVVAIVGIAAASGAAWWYQNKPSGSSAASAESAGTTGAAGSGSSASSASSASGSAVGAGASRPLSVEVAKAEKSRVSDDVQAVGSLRSRRSVILRPEVSGRITQLNFRDGDRVKKGQVLVQFDDQLQAAQMQQSNAELSIAVANHKRNQELVSQNFISQRSVDESSAALEVANAKLALAKATTARLKIIAPFDGIAGIRTVNIGDYLKDGADIVNIEDLEAIYVDYRLPERYQAKVKRGQTAAIELDALPGRKFSAVVMAIDPLLDANGRSVAVRGCIDNRDLQLRPGMFARTTTVFGVKEDAVVVPEEAIVPQGNRLFVIRLVDGPDAQTRTTQRVEVKTGIRRPGKVEIVSGLTAGDVVVTAGQQRIQRDAMTVRIMEVGGGNKSGGGPREGGASSMPQASASASSSGAPGAPVASVGSPAAAYVAPTVKPRTATGPNPCITQDVASAGRSMESPVPTVAPPSAVRPTPTMPSGRNPA